MSFQTRLNTAAISMKLTIYSANLAPIRSSSGLFKKNVDPISYVQVHVFNQNNPQTHHIKKTTKKSKTNTTNPQFHEKIDIIVTPEDRIKFIVMSYHQSKADKIIGECEICMNNICERFPPAILSATLTEKLVRGEPLKNEKGQLIFGLEEFPNNIFPDMTLQIQVNDWPALCNALLLLKSEYPENNSFNESGSHDFVMVDRNLAQTGVNSSPGNLNGSRGSLNISPSQNRNRAPSALSNRMSGLNLGSSNLVDTDDPLPQYYERRKDPNTSQYYYVDHLMRTTSWKRPLPLPSGWERRKDARSDRQYFVDHDHRRTQWHHPLEDENGNLLSTTGKTTAEDDQQEQYRRYQERNLSGLINSNTEDQMKKQTSSGNDQDLDYNKLSEAAKNKSDSDNFLIDEEQEELEVIKAEDIEKVFGPLKSEAGWEQKQSGGRTYYLNHIAKVSQWEDPRTMGYEVRDSLPRGWQRQYTEDGLRFWDSDFWP